MTTSVGAQSSVNIDKILAELNFETNELETKFTVIVNSPHEDQRKVCLVPQIIEFEENQYWIADIYILILNNQYQTLAKTRLKSAITSDAIELRKIEIINSPFCFSRDKYGFGLTLTYRNNSRAASGKLEKGIFLEYDENTVAKLLEVTLNDEIRFSGNMKCEDAEMIKSVKRIEILEESEASGYGEIKIVQDSSKYRFTHDCNAQKIDNTTRTQLYEMRNGLYQIKQ